MSKPQLLNLKEQFLHCCATEGTRLIMRALQTELQQLSKKKQRELIYKGFLIACKEGNCEGVEDILSNPFYGFSNLDILYNGLQLALEKNHMHVVQYVLEQSRFELTKYAGGEPFFSYNMNLFLRAFGQREMINTEAVEFLANYIETHVKQKDGEDFNLLSYKDYHFFKSTLHFSNKEGAEFLINRYNITGAEPEIQERLANIHFWAPAIAEYILTLMRINLEKPMLEAQIGNGTDNMTDSMTAGKVGKNRQINKI